MTVSVAKVLASLTGLVETHQTDMLVMFYNQLSPDPL